MSLLVNNHGTEEVNRRSWTGSALLLEPVYISTSSKMQRPLVAVKKITVKIMTKLLLCMQTNP